MSQRVVAVNSAALFFSSRSNASRAFPPLDQLEHGPWYGWAYRAARASRGVPYWIAFT